MKTLVGKLVSVAALMVATTPLVSLAQNVVSPPTVNRSLDRLTLLPGPYLLSPARPASPPTPVLYFVPEAREGFRTGFPFSTGGAVRVGPGILTLGGSGSIFIPTFGPTPVTLRFESTLHAPPAPGQFRFVPGPKPD